MLVFFFVGFVSMQSIRASTQSTSIKRSSEQSVQSSKSNCILSSCDSHALKSMAIHEDFVEKSSSSSLSSTTTTASSSQQQVAMSSFSNENFAATTAKMFLDQNGESERISTTSSTTSSASMLAKVNSIEIHGFSNDNVFALPNTNEEPPALPVKTRTRSSRRERHISQYDNVEETDTFSKSV